MNAGLQFRLLIALGLSPCILACIRIWDERTLFSVLISAAVSVCGFLAVRLLVPVIKASTLRAGLHGLDINKKGTEAGEKKIPEALGLASGVVFLVCHRRSVPPTPFKQSYTSHRKDEAFISPSLIIGHWLLPATKQVCMVLFQQLHYYDAASMVHWLTRSGSWSDAVTMTVYRASDAWYVGLLAHCA
jgi:hypothetical protein